MRPVQLSHAGHCRRFNEAGAASPRKFLRRTGTPVMASMRPGQLRPGNRLDSAPKVQLPVAAASMRPGQLRPGNSELRSAADCFNEAGAASPRKWALMAESSLMAAMGASMRPGQLRPGNHRDLGVAGASMRPGQLRPGNHAGGHQAHASMRPGQLRPGNLA